MTENIIFTKDERIILEKTVGELLLKHIKDGWDFNKLEQWVEELRGALVTSKYCYLKARLTLTPTAELF